MRLSSHWKLCLLLFPIIGTCVLASPGGQRGFFQAWYGATYAASVDPNVIAIADATLFINFDGTFDDQSANAISATSNDNVSFAGSIGTFDGTNDWLHYGDSATVEVGTNDFTQAVWVNLTDYQPGQIGFTNRSHIIGNTLDGQYRGGGIYFANSFTFQFRTASGVVTASDTNEVAFGSWYHVATVFDRDGNAQMYINGEPTVSISIAYGNGVDLQDSRNWGVGARTHDNAFDFYGKMDSIYYFKRALTSDEILTLYNAGHDQ